jgi:hypothetical protein
MIPIDLSIQRGAEALDRLRSRQAVPSEINPLSSARNSIDGPVSSLLQPLRVIGLNELIKMEIALRSAVLSPWLMAQSLNMIYGWRGVGKTHVSLGIAHAVASGGSFLNWTAETPRRVLLLDGEMPQAALQERFARIVASNDLQAEEPPLFIITPDVQVGIMPDLSTHRGQEVVNSAIEQYQAELIIVDNLSCLVRGNGRENDAESWVSVSEWALWQRQQGRSVLFIHHAGKGGQQRGTSKREDLLDVVISLRRPPNYDPAEGACFEIHFEKARHLFGDDTKPIEAKLTQDAKGQACWTTRSVEETTLDRVVELANEGLSQSEIANELGVTPSAISKACRKAEEQGKITVMRSAKGSNQYQKRGK